MNGLGLSVGECRRPFGTGASVGSLSRRCNREPHSTGEASCQPGRSRGTLPHNELRPVRCWLNEARLFASGMPPCQKRTRAAPQAGGELE
jgi:hypothetical protein